MRLPRHIAVALLLLGIGLAGNTLLPMPALAQTQVADEPLADAALEARARALMKEVRCVVCQAQSIDESDAGIANDMRRLIRQQISAGKSDTEILTYLSDRYGDFVLFKPPFKPATALLWAGPFLLLLIGGTVIVFFFRRRSGTPAKALSTAELDRIAAALDQAEDDTTSAPQRNTRTGDA